LYDGNISVYAHTVPGLYLAMTLNHSGGLLLRWFRDEMCQAQVAQAATENSDAYDLILGADVLEPSSLLVLPHFAGSGTPTFDTVSKGAILGLTFGATKREIARAILEGLTFELRLNLDLLQNAGIPIEELRAIGGGARSDVWMQLKADVTGIPVAVPAVTEAACWGAAILGGVAAGVYESAAVAAAEAVSLTHRINPDADRRQRYDARFKLYQQVYPTLQKLNHQL
jgi:xylulokinase